MSKLFNLVPVFIFSFNLVLIFVKIKLYCSSLNWDSIYFLYEFYGDTLTNINIFIKYL